uniref:Bulb-type lectin domain-containing protein n=1 Tax=Nelumbo nucifera TaxID=4432 RepID=A0A822Z530_NELNU|nr:TPA_asm: hypothetical protein HUJ06_015787 [Nelumbo nucifera]
MVHLWILPGGRTQTIQLLNLVYQLNGVWMANRDRPVNGHRSKVSLHRDGKMVLTDAYGLIVWSINTSDVDVYRFPVPVQ